MTERLLCETCIMSEFVDLPYAGYCRAKEHGVMPTETCRWHQPRERGWLAALSAYAQAAQALAVRLPDERWAGEQELSGLVGLRKICRQKAKRQRERMPLLALATEDEP